MLTRIITAVLALGILIPILIFGGVWGACAIFAVICAFSVYEMLDCCGLRKNYSVSIPFVIFGASSLLPIAIQKALGDLSFLSIRDITTEEYYKVLMRLSNISSLILGTLPLLWVIFATVIGYNKIDVERLFMFFGLYEYITIGFNSLLRLRVGISYSPSADSFGLKLMFFVLIVAWGTDTFAYFSGLAFGKRKLCPNISPKKTVAGAVGGTLFGSILGAAFILLSAGVSDVTIIIAVCTPLLSIVSQFGDLAASVIKRKFGVKDYGKIFPGHGGVLDRFDSVLLTSIVAFALLSAAANLL